MDHGHIHILNEIRGLVFNNFNQYAIRMAFLLSASRGQTENVENAINAGANIETKNEAGDTSLMLAASHGHIGTVRFLIQKHANVNAKNKIDETPLMLAAKNGHTKIVDLLIENGADIESKNSNGLTPTMHAAISNHSFTMLLLIQKGANLNALDNENKTALIHADSKKNSEIINLWFSVHTQEEIQKFISDIPNFLVINNYINGFKEAVIEHRMSVFNILRPLAFESNDANKPNYFLYLPEEVIGHIASYYCALLDEKAWHIPHAHLDGLKISEAIAKTRLLTFSANAPGNGKKRKPTDVLQEGREIKKVKINDFNEPENNNDDILVEEIEIESNSRSSAWCTIS